MIDPNLDNRKQPQNLHQQKAEVMKVLMNELIENPAGVEVDELKKVIDYLDKSATDDVTP